MSDCPSSMGAWSSANVRLRLMAGHCPPITDATMPQHALFRRGIRSRIVASRDGSVVLCRAKRIMGTRRAPKFGLATAGYLQATASSRV